MQKNTIFVKLNTEYCNCPCLIIQMNSRNCDMKNKKGSFQLIHPNNDWIVPDHVAFLNQVTYSGNLVQTELPIERKPNQITFGWTVLPSRDCSVFPQMQIAKGDVFS